MPKLLEILIMSILPPDDFCEKAGDIEEVYYNIKKEKGKLNANTWIILQIILALPSFIVNRICWGNIMFRNYLTITTRIIRKYKTFSFINILGLGTGLAVFILIGLFVKNEFEYNTQHKNYDEIYRVNVKYTKSDNSFSTSFSPVPLAKTLERNIPEILKSVRFANFGEILFKKDNISFNERRYAFVDKDIFNVFSIDLINKSERNPLERLNTIVISKSIAKKYFGDSDPIGKFIQANSDTKLEVTAVMENPPQNSFMMFDIYISIETLRKITGDDYFNNKISTQLRSFVLTTKGSDINEIRKKSLDYLNNNYYDKNNGEETIEFDPLSDIHLYSEVARTGDFNIVLIFIISGILILLIACINFMNLSTAKSTTRAKEIGIRKSTGATRSELIKQFFGESFIFSFFSLMLAIILVALLLPAFNNLTGMKLELKNLINFEVITFLSVIWFITSVLAGSYPALYLSKFDPVDVMNGKVSNGKKALNFRRILVVVQFTIAIALIASTFIINQQLNFMLNKNQGFDSEQMLVVKLQGDKFRENPFAFKNELIKNPQIKNVAFSDLLPSSIGSYNIVSWEGAPPNKTVSISQTLIEPDFIKTYGLKTIYGPEKFEMDSPELNDGIIINESAAKRFGWKEDAIGKKLIMNFGSRVIEYKVLAVIQDFHFSSMRNEISPLKLRFKKQNFRLASIKLKTDNVDEAIKFVKNKLTQLNPEYPFDYYFLDQVFERRYRSEKNLQEIFTYFSILTLIISCLGLLGLASFLAVQKTKEIGIRKVLGASSGKIVYLLSRDFLKYVLISNLIAWPIAYLFIRNWLDEFAYRIELNPFVLIISGIIALITAFGAVGYQAVKASNNNPVNSLRSE